MRHTEKQWCNTCKQMTYGCKHPEDDATKNIIRLPKREPKMRRMFCSFEQLAIPAQSHTAIVTAPQVPFKAERMVVDPVLAPFFRLIDIRVGKDCQTVAPMITGVGCSIFTAKADGLAPLNNLEGIDISQCGMYFALLVVNIDHNSCHDFNALVWGQAIF